MCRPKSFTTHGEASYWDLGVKLLCTLSWVIENVLFGKAYVKKNSSLADQIVPWLYLEGDTYQMVESPSGY